MRSLPNESPLNSASRSNAAASAVPTNAFNNMRLNEPPPPAYNTPTPPSLPSRQPSQTSSRPEIARAIALYRYAEPEDDCTFEVGDYISVFEYMNADWWLGKNMRTGKEGVFPVNYVQVQINKSSPPQAQDGYGNEKASGYGGYGGQQSQLPPPGPSNPYDSSIPPMAVASQPVDNRPPGKGQENAKKFGKKLGNAAVFGAGATLGGKIVNSIF
jgi:LAS seventeen-binding protein 1/2